MALAAHRDDEAARPIGDPVQRFDRYVGRGQELGRSLGLVDPGMSADRGAQRSDRRWRGGEDEIHRGPPLDRGNARQTKSELNPVFAALPMVRGRAGASCPRNSYRISGISRPLDSNTQWPVHPEIHEVNFVDGTLGAGLRPAGRSIRSVGFAATIGTMMLAREEMTTRPPAPAGIVDTVPVRALLLGERLD